jgi:hypothetical protein
MKPEFTARQNSPHANVLCVDCHVAPGAQAWVASEVAGTHQFVDVVFHRVRQPIESELTSGRLVPSRLTCEQCHWPQMLDEVKLRVIEHFKDDAANTQTLTVLMVLTGGGDLGGIHGKHMGSGVQIQYAATDGARQTIPWVGYRNVNTGDVQTFVAEGADPQSIVKLRTYEMQSVDCLNRSTHTVELPEIAVDRALALGRISSTPPFFKKKAVEFLKANYTSNKEALRIIPAGLTDFYRQSDPALRTERAQDISAAGAENATIYNRNVFPDLTVTWGTYPNNLIRNDFPGCFRCHDGSHSTLDQKATITQDCSACQKAIVVDEAPPGVLKTLDLSDYVTSLQKK